MTEMPSIVKIQIEDAMNLYFPRDFDWEGLEWPNNCRLCNFEALSLAGACIHLKKIHKIYCSRPRQAAAKRKLRAYPYTKGEEVKKLND